MSSPESDKGQVPRKSSNRRKVGRVIVVVVALGVFALVIIRAVASSGGSDAPMAGMSMSGGSTMSAGESMPMTSSTVVMTMPDGSTMPMSGMSMDAAQSVPSSSSTAMMTMPNGMTMPAAEMTTAVPTPSA
ncbi:hypothetical protein [Propionibacterium sp.]|uniref:hypothetical protein n=1 Tax=Propionibacterium sp. TaxID=1977903 RepID=UPI0039E79B0A